MYTYIYIYIYEIPSKFALIKYVLECASDVGCCMKPAKTIGGSQKKRWFSPTLTCGVFATRPPTHPPTHARTHERTHALTHSFAWQAWHLVLCKGSDVRPGVPWSPVAFAWQARHLVLWKGSDVCPGVPWSPPLCRWPLRVRGGCGTWSLGALQGVGCTLWRPLVSAARPVAFAWHRKMNR